MDRAGGNEAGKAAARRQQQNTESVGFIAVQECGRRKEGSVVKGVKRTGPAGARGRQDSAGGQSGGGGKQSGQAGGGRTATRH